MSDDDRLLTPSTVRRLLDEHGLAPRRSAGQNFVVDPNTVRKIVRDAAVGPDDLVIEVGPGLGSLTVALSRAADQVIAVEVDAGLVRALEDVVGGRPNVDIVHGDALEVDLDALAGGRPARLIANLPYNVATPIVLSALDGTAITDLHVMVQREVGERWAARPGDAQYGAVSVKVRLAAEVEIVASVPRTVFHPAPKVDSVTVRMVRRADAPPVARRRRVGRVVEAAFAQRRKTIRNSLRTLVDDPVPALERAGIDPGTRAETLDVDDYVRLTAVLGPHLDAA